MKCPNCLCIALLKAKFCNQCGHDLRLTCASCGTKNSAIPTQGLTEKILARKDKIEGERKQVTVMFCDMVGFTELSEKIGPEDAYSIMDRVYEILIHKVHEFGGTVNEMTGDGVLALLVPR